MCFPDPDRFTNCHELLDHGIEMADLGFETGDQPFIGIKLFGIFRPVVVGKVVGRQVDQVQGVPDLMRQGRGSLRKHGPAVHDAEFLFKILGFEQFFCHLVECRCQSADFIAAPVVDSHREVAGGNGFGGEVETAYGSYELIQHEIRENKEGQKRGPGQGDIARVEPVEEFAEIVDDE